MTIHPASTEDYLHEIGKQYEVLAVLGKGGMGTTFKAKDRTTGEHVCVKQLHPNTDKRSLEQEYKALVRLNHPNIVKVLRFTLDPKNPVIVMELIDGFPLRAIFHSNSRLFRLPEITGIFIGIFDAISFAHAQGVIHRDLKPENVLLKETDGRLVPKVFDFGLSIIDLFDHNQALTAIDSFAGTTPYMAPEQLRGEILSGACDVYALGQMIWELWHGAPAFPGSRVDIAMAKLNTDGLTITRQGIPADYAELIQRCTRLNPAARPKANDVGDRLKNFPVVPANSRSFGWQGPDWPSNWT